MIESSFERYYIICTHKRPGQSNENKLLSIYSSVYEEPSVFDARWFLIPWTTINGGRVILDDWPYSTAIRKLNGLCCVGLSSVPVCNVNEHTWPRRTDANRTHQAVKAACGVFIFEWRTTFREEKGLLV